MDMKTILGKLSALTSESLAMTGGSFKPGQGETAVDKQKCVSCGRTIQGRPRTTEDGDPICQACDDRYAIGGAGEHELDEDKMCETCGKPMEQCECEEMEEGWKGATLGAAAGEALAPELTPVSGAVGAVVGSELGDMVSGDEEEMEEARSPYAVGMAQAMKQTGDEPPLEKSTIKKAHEIAKSIEQDREELEEATCPQCHKDPCMCKSETNEDVFEAELAELVPSVQENPTISFSRALFYLSNAFQSLGFAPNFQLICAFIDVLTCAVKYRLVFCLG